jgi:hypothetical protein
MLALVAVIVGAVVFWVMAVLAVAVQPLAAGIVYVTVYVPAVLELGVICPELGLIVKPPGLAL